MPSSRRAHVYRAWRTNSRNCALFEDFLVARATKNMNKEGGEGGGAAETKLTDAEAKKLADASKKKGYLNRKTGEKVDSAPPSAAAHQVPGGLPGSSTAGAGTGESGTTATGADYGGGAQQPARSRSFWSKNKKSTAGTNANAAPAA